MKVLVTGGAGYIGSTVATACLDAGIDVVVIDDLSKGRPEFTAGRAYYQGDFADREILDIGFSEHPDLTAVVHCAAKIVVPESVSDPIGYYDNNVTKTISFVDYLTNATTCRKILFSSSASMYVAGPDLTVDESSTVAPSSPYSRTKQVVELFLEDVANSGALDVTSLRYFNPVGADPRMHTGLQAANPTHALGLLIQAHQAGETFTITGTEWPTRDGSAVRDYIHVWDLARAHVLALQKFDELASQSPYTVFNLGTGTGTTVRELVAAFAEVVGVPLSVDEAPPRPGDVVGCFTISEKADKILGWKAEKSLTDGIRDSLLWADQRKAILGY